MRGTRFRSAACSRGRRPSLPATALGNSDTLFFFAVNRKPTWFGRLCCKLRRLWLGQQVPSPQQWERSSALFMDLGAQVLWPAWCGECVLTRNHCFIVYRLASPVHALTRIHGDWAVAAQDQ
jgi:hypothetical protein